MKIFVKAKPKAKKEYVEKIDDKNFIVAVNEPPADGQANEAIIRALSKYFGVNQQDIKIISGKTSRRKLISIG